MDFGAEQFGRSSTLLQLSWESQPLWEISDPATLIESDRISKLKFKKRRECIHF